MLRVFGVTLIITGLLLLVWKWQTNAPENEIQLWSRWSDYANISASVIAGLGFLVGAGLIIVNSKLATAQKAEIERIQRASDEKVAEANSVAAKANLLAKKIEQENIRLKENLSNRQLTKEEYRILVVELSKHSEAFYIQVVPDHEAAVFASDIEKTFIDAGWEFKGRAPTIYMGLTGLIITPSSNPIVKTISKAFEVAHIPHRIENYQSDAGFGGATILIGGKPSTF